MQLRKRLKVRNFLIERFLTVNSIVTGAKKPRMTIHVDVMNRKKASKKRKYEVAFTAESDPLFK